MRHRIQHPRGNVMGAFIFGTVITAVILGAVLASHQVFDRATTANNAGLALLEVGDRLQTALLEVNAQGQLGDQTGTVATAHTRINTDEQCTTHDGGELCTSLTVTPNQTTPDGRTGIKVEVTASTTSNTEAKRRAYITQIPTKGEITGVDELGRLQFVEVPPGTSPGEHVDIWELVGEEDVK